MLNEQQSHDLTRVSPQTARALCSGCKIYFAGIPIIGIASSALFSNLVHLSSRLNLLIPHFVSTAAKIWLGFFLLRSTYELPQIRDNLGSSVYEISFLTYASITLINLIVMFFSIRQMNLRSVTPDNAKRVIALVGVIFGFIIFRPPVFTKGLLFENYIDPQGFYLARESVLVSIGYFYVMSLTVNIIAEIRRRRA